MTKIAVTGLVFSRIVVSVAIFSMPVTAQASILSLVTSLFSSQAAAAGTSISGNSQKMALLEAPVNSNVRAAASGSDLVVDNDALMPVSDTLSEGEGEAFVASSNEIKTYKVQAGDTVTGIAKKYAISANTILWANNLSRTTALKEGQTLVILPISGVQHKVKSGDTLQAIAKKYNGDVDEIVAYNNVSNSTLKAGDVIVIPDGEIVSTSPSTSSSAAKVATKKAPLLKPDNALSSLALGVGIASADDSSASFYVRPLKGGVRTQGIHGNNGVDLAASCGTPLYASAGGEVIISKNDGGYNGGYGNYVVISHSNGSQTLYGHMESTAVSVGQTVSQGDYIGNLGNTGKVHGVTGCHVHFEIRNGIANPF